MKQKRETAVTFVDEETKRAYEKLKQIDSKMYKFLSRAIDDLKRDVECGIKVSKKLMPKEYIRRYGINNLWKYNLPGAWRMLYSLKGSQVLVLAVILDWMDHKDYEKLFRY